MTFGLWLLIGLLVDVLLILYVIVGNRKYKKYYFQDPRFWLDLVVCVPVWPMIVFYVVFALISRFMARIGIEL